jgi:hypothetical protein
MRERGGEEGEKKFRSDIVMRIQEYHLAIAARLWADMVAHYRPHCICV